MDASDTCLKRFQSFKAQQLLLEGFPDTETKSCWLVAQTCNFQNTKWLVDFIESLTYEGWREQENSSTITEQGPWVMEGVKERKSKLCMALTSSTKVFNDLILGQCYGASPTNGKDSPLRMLLLGYCHQESHLKCLTRKRKLCWVLHAWWNTSK